jgi:hypothetical protein
MEIVDDFLETGFATNLLYNLFHRIWHTSELTSYNASKKVVLKMTPIRVKMTS